MLVDPEPALQDIRVPTLLLWGDKDAMIPIRNAADYLRNLEAAWAPIERLVYFILFPALLLNELAVADLHGVPVARMAAALLATQLVMATATWKIPVLEIRSIVRSASPSIVRCSRPTERWAFLRKRHRS